MAKNARFLRYALGGAALTALLATSAVAAGSQMGGGGWFGPLAEMDADDSGSVTRGEIDSFTATRAAEIDADGNGEVTAEELQAWHEAQRQKRMAAHLAAMDSDGDGKVSVDELQAAATWRLARLDRNGDGEIESGEMKRHRRHHGGSGHGGMPSWRHD